MALETYPASVRGLDIVIGFAIIFLGGWIILDTTILEAMLVFLLAIGLVFIGFTRVGKGIVMKEAKDPRNPDLWFNLHLVLWITRRYEEASESFKKARKYGWDKKKSKITGI